MSMISLIIKYFPRIISSSTSGLTCISLCVSRGSRAQVGPTHPPWDSLRIFELNDIILHLSCFSAVVGPRCCIWNGRFVLQSWCSTFGGGLRWVELLNLIVVVFRSWCLCSGCRSVTGHCVAKRHGTWRTAWCTSMCLCISGMAS